MVGNRNSLATVAFTLVFSVAPSSANEATEHGLHEPTAEVQRAPGRSSQPSTGPPDRFHVELSPTPMRVALDSKAEGDPWWEIATKLLASVAAVISAGAAFYGLIIPARHYLETRASELKWKQFETTRKLWSDFTSDPEMREVIRLIETRSDELRRLFTTTADDASAIPYDDRNRVDRYFEFLESLVYAIGTSTLTRDDVAVFGWHFDQFVEFPELGQYCRDRSYGAVVRFAESFKDRPPLAIDPAA